MAKPQHRPKNQPNSAHQAERERHREPHGPAGHPSHATNQPGFSAGMGVPTDADPGATVSTEAVRSSTPSGATQRSWHPAPDVWPDTRTDSAADFRASISADSGQQPTQFPAYHPDSGELPGSTYTVADSEDYAAQDAVAPAPSDRLAESFDDSLDDSLNDSLDDSLDDGLDDEIFDETGEGGEWSVADQPTVALLQRDTAPGVGQPAHPAHRGDTRAPKLTRPILPRTSEARPDLLGGDRYSSPDGALMPITPPVGIPRSALGNPRMERFQELRQQRKAHEHGERGPQDPPQVKEVVRNWWQDLTPGLQRALNVQHEARASGVYPTPSYITSAMVRMGDVFGKLAISTRDLANRAQATAGPALKRMHDQAEAAAQALIERLEGTPVQQQAPFLGPGRLAVLFRSGVTVGQAQRLLQSVRARPLRLIPRKHGLLAMVTRGAEAAVAERLKQHPYVRDVIYMEYADPSQSLSVEVPAIMGMRQS